MLFHNPKGGFDFLKRNKFQEFEPRILKKEVIKELVETHNYLGTECA